MSGQDPLIRPSQSFEGMVFQPDNDQELFRVVGLAFDYRGDVTILLRSGQQVTGYVFDRHERADYPYLRVFVENHPDPQLVPYAEIENIVFSGQDTAFGRSWDDWAKKWNKDAASP